MTTNAPDSPRRALHAALTAAKLAVALRNSFHWAGEETIGAGCVVACPGTSTRRAKQAIDAALSPWIRDIAGLFPNFTLASILVTLERKITLAQTPRPFVPCGGFDAALRRYCARVGGRLFEQPASRVPAGKSGVLSFGLLDKRPALIGVYGGLDGSFEIEDLDGACFASCAGERAAWMQGIHSFRVGFLLPPMTAHRRAEILRGFAPTN